MYDLQILHTANLVDQDEGKIIDMGIYNIVIQDWESVSQKILHQRHMYTPTSIDLLYKGVYKLQILHTAGLVGQYQQKIIAMGVQLTYIMIHNRQTMEKPVFFLQISHQRLCSYFDICTCTYTFSTKGCTFSRFCTQLA